MTRWIAPIAAAALALTPAAFAETAKPGTTAVAPKLEPDSFAQQALQSGENEVALAKLAIATSQSAKVKEFAQMVAADHERVNEQLRIVLKQGAGPDRKAAAPGTGPNRTDDPASPPSTSPGAAPSSPEHKQLSGLSGAEFDKAFMRSMVVGHAKSVELYEQAAQSLPAGAAKKLAEDTLPKIKQHFEQARSLEGEVSAEKK